MEKVLEWEELQKVLEELEKVLVTTLQTVYTPSICHCHYTPVYATVTTLQSMSQSLHSQYMSQSLSLSLHSRLSRTVLCDHVTIVQSSFHGIRGCHQFNQGSTAVSQCPCLTYIPANWHSWWKVYKLKHNYTQDTILRLIILFY